MITRIRIRNFKSLFDVTVNLGPFTVFIGKNGAGKSSFLQGIQLLSWLVRYRSINEALAANDLTYNELVYLRASSLAIHWEVDLTLRDPAKPSQFIDAHVEISLAKRRHVHVTTELVHPQGMTFGEATQDGPFAVGRLGRLMMASENDKRFSYENVSLPHSVLLDASSRREEFPVLGAIADELAQFLHYEIWGPEPLRQPSKGTATILAERGQNLPSVLHSIRDKQPGRFVQLVQEIQSAYGWLDSIEIRRLGQGRFALSFLERVKDKRKRRVRYEPTQVSDGFLRLLALTALKYQLGTVSLLGYEEPENGMHPGMLTESVERLRDVARAGTQVIVTTHSPFLLQYVLSKETGGNPEEELRLVWRGDDGKTEVRAPDRKILDHARSQGIGIGELWSMLLDESRMAEGNGTGRV